MVSCTCPPVQIYVYREVQTSRYSLECLFPSVHHAYSIFPASCRCCLNVASTLKEVAPGDEGHFRGSPEDPHDQRTAFFLHLQDDEHLCQIDNTDHTTSKTLSHGADTKRGWLAHSKHVQRPKDVTGECLLLYGNFGRHEVKWKKSPKLHMLEVNTSVGSEKICRVRLLPPDRGIDINLPRET